MAEDLDLIAKNNQEEEQEEQQVEQVSNDTPQEEEQPEFALDEDGNLHWNTNEYDHLDDEDSEPQQEEEQPNEEETEETHEEKQEEEPKYKVTVDGQEIEVTQDELLRGYMRQSDYTRKTQQLANDRQQVEQFYRQQRQVQQQPPQDTQTSLADSEKELNNVAKRMAAQRLGLESAEDLSELDFDHITAVVEAKQALINQRNAFMSRRQSIDNLEMQLRQEEPQYDAIMRMVEQKIPTMPFNEVSRLQRAYSDGNPEPLRALFHEIQKDYYSNAIKKVDDKRNKQVPKVVPSGNTPIGKQAQNKRIDFRKFGQMSTDQKAKMLLDMGFVD